MTSASVSEREIEWYTVGIQPAPAHPAWHPASVRPESLAWNMFEYVT